MATKRKPAETETEEQLLEQPAEETQPKDDQSEKLKAQQAEIEKLKAQLAAAQQANKPGVRQNDAEIVRKACEEAVKDGVDLWTVKVNVRSPRKPGKEDPWYWLNVNGRSVQIPADDKYYELALPWAETLINSLEAERRAADFQDQLEVYDPVTNPHKN